MKLKALILMCLLSTSAFAFEPPADQDCVEVQRECEPDAKQLDSNKWGIWPRTVQFELLLPP